MSLSRELDPARLLPPPQRCTLGSQRLTFPAELSAPLSTELAQAGAKQRLERALQARGHALVVRSSSDGGLITARIDAAVGAGDAYRLRIGPHGINLVGGGAPGLFYAVCTLVQLIELAPRTAALVLPELEIEDYPDFPVRGVMLDVSRDKVPTLSTLKLLIDRLASWKVNQLQLYMEHTFAYAGHEKVWRDASAFTAAEIRELDVFARSRHVELVPNQNSFGHMQRWLVHEPYRQLAECPDGFLHPWNPSAEPYGLCPTDPGSLRLLEDLYDQLLPVFGSRKFNVGLDETLDLGAGRSRKACEALGTERVYLQFLKEVHARVRARGHDMLFWADIIVKRPDLVSELPADAIALEWGYEADHPFADHLAIFRGAGLDCYVCPGTSSWNSIAGRSHNAIANIANAGRAGRAGGAVGLLNTDWGDHGHLQPLCVSQLGFVMGAAASWHASCGDDPPVERWLDDHAFADGAGVLGRVARDLGDSYLFTGSPRPNASVLFWSLIKPERLFSPPGVTRESLEKTLDHIERARAPLALAEPHAEDGELVKEEFVWVADLCTFACRIASARCDAAGTRSLASVPRAARLTLASSLDSLIERHRALWLKRNRPGGLDDSARRLERLREQLTA